MTGAGSGGLGQGGRWGGGAVPLEGATNFRDLGGIPAPGGCRVRPGRVYRSEALARLTPRDWRRVAALGVREAFDLRYPDERERAPTRPPPGVALVVHALGLPARPEPSWQDSLEPASRDPEAARRYLVASYRSYPRLYAPAYRRILERLARPEGEGAVVIHCTAGKDRAGLAAAVVLRALGVEWEAILADYLATNAHWDRGGLEPPGWPREVLDAIFTARAEYLEAAFEAIEGEQGGFGGWLERRVGVDGALLGALRSRLLERPC